MLWKKLTKDQIKERVFRALDENRSFDSDNILGIPGTYLDTEQFYRDAEFLADAPFLKTFINNPNHIGCHTLTGDEGEDLFRGTQRLEIELIRMVSEEILKAAPRSVDGYVAPGGTEANIQAMWVYRNYYQKEFSAKNHQIAVVFSEDSHYSFYKGANLLNIKTVKIPVGENSRKLEKAPLKKSLAQARKEGIQYFIAVANMSTTMFGSIDDPDLIADTFEEMELPYKLHVDGAFGGFIYPFTQNKSKLDFKNPRITSITLDAHKMLMAPYGTGIFLIRKNWMHYAATAEAQYVQGLDYTMVGSRNGAQAVAIWMILQTHGPDGWRKNISELMRETDKLCAVLKELNVAHYRDEHVNIVSMRAADVPPKIPQKYRLVADNFEGHPQWWKIVVMQHTKGKIIDNFIADMERELKP